jgi:hypothetical protein
MTAKNLLGPEDEIVFEGDRLKKFAEWVRRPEDAIPAEDRDGRRPVARGVQR